MIRIDRYKILERVLVVQQLSTKAGPTGNRWHDSNSGKSLFPAPAILCGESDRGWGRQQKGENQRQRAWIEEEDNGEWLCCGMTAENQAQYGTYSIIDSFQRTTRVVTAVQIPHVVLLPNQIL